MSVASSRGSGRDPNEVSILLKSLDTGWETVGAEALRYRGVWPENVQYTHNDWGDDTCSFVLRRDPGAIHPDLSAFTDCEIWVAGVLAWSGRVKETPTSDDDMQINVQGQGWQSHLDDDQYKWTYVNSQVEGWQDARSFPDCDLSQFHANAEVNGNTIGWRSGATINTNDRVAIVLDLGVSAAKRVYTTWKMAYGGAVASGASYLIGLIAADDLGVLLVSGADTVWSRTPTPAAGLFVDAGFITARRRYLAFVVSRTGANTTTTTDVTFTLQESLVFSDDAYDSAGSSALSADMIVNDALDRATLLLDPDRSDVLTGAFSGIPEFGLAGYSSPREVMQAANAYENYELKIDGRRPVFRPRASSPTLEIGEWSGAQFQDASANSGEEILSRVIVEGTGPDGLPMSVIRSQGESGAGPFDIITSPTVTNPSAAVNTTGWTNATRDTATFDTSPASFQATSPTALITGSMTGNDFKAGVTYQLSLRARILWTGGTGIVAYGWYYAEFGDLAGGDYVSMLVPRSTTWQTLQLVWTPSADSASSGVSFRGRYVSGQNGSVLSSARFDTLSLSRSLSTLVEKRGFVRTRTLPIRNRMVPASAARIGDVYLQGHRTTPFTGGFKATGIGGVRRVLGGARIHPGWLGRQTGQIVMVGNVIDPDTGGVGRSERIQSVQYDHDNLTATVNMSEDRGGFDALLERLAAVVK